MKALYLVTLSANLNRDAVITGLTPLRGFGTWFYSMPSSFFIYSSRTARDICGTIQKMFGENERVFVAKVTNSEYHGWMPKTHWAIIDNKGAERRYDLSFKGYYLNSKDLMESPGVYCVYRCVYSKSDNRVTINQLLYVGQASVGVRKRHENHEKFQEWEKRLLPGEQLCYSCAEVGISDLDRVESALIYLNQPVCNEKGKDAFGFYDTYIVVEGASLLLKAEGLVEQTK